jgi:cytochrome c oxidase subunit 3
MSEQSHGNHPYHMVEPSKWPIVGSIGAFVTMFTLVIYLHPDMLGSGLESFFEAIGLWVVVPGAIIVMYTMMGWWRDVINEATVQKLHTSFVQISLRYGMALFIASEVMFFAAFFWAFFDASLFPKEAAGFMWPPEGIEILETFDLPLRNTIILLT